MRNISRSLLKRFFSETLIESPPKKDYFHIYNHNSGFVIPCFDISLDSKDREPELYHKKIKFFLEHDIDHYICGLRKALSPDMLTKIGELSHMDDIKCVGLKYRLHFDLDHFSDEIKNSMQMDWIHKTKEVVQDKFTQNYMELGTFYDIQFDNGETNSIQMNQEKAQNLKKLFIQNKPKFQGTNDILKFPPLTISNDDDTQQIYDIFSQDKLAIDLDYVKEYDLRQQKTDIVDPGEKTETSFLEETPMRIMFKEMFTYSNHIQEIIIRNHSLKRLIEDCNDHRKSVGPSALMDFFKLCDYKGQLSFNLNFQELSDVEIAEMDDYVCQVMECLQNDKFELMCDRDYQDFTTIWSDRDKVNAGVTASDIHVIV